MGWASTLEDIVDRFNESSDNKSTDPPVTLQRCPICNARVRRLQRHVRRIHGNPTFQDSRQTPSNSSSHRTLTHCDQCGCLVRTDRLAKHKLKVHDEFAPPKSAGPSAMRTPKLWIYKCNANDVQSAGDWNVFFEDLGGAGQWGGTWCINNGYSRQILLEQMDFDDLVLAWQTDQRAAIGLCRVTDLPNDGEHIAIHLETVKRFREPIRLLALKKQFPALANGIGFKQGKLGTLFDTTADEAKIILKLCDASKGVA